MAFIGASNGRPWVNNRQAHIPYLNHARSTGLRFENLICTRFTALESRLRNCSIAENIILSPISRGSMNAPYTAAPKGATCPAFWRACQLVQPV